MLEGPKGELLKKSWKLIVFTSGDIEAPVNEYTPHPKDKNMIITYVSFLYAFKFVVFYFTV